MRMVVPLVGWALLMGAGCGGECPVGQHEHPVSGKCVVDLSSGPPAPVPPVTDAGPRDTSTSTRADSGLPDAAPADAGPVDAGDAGPRADYTEVWAEELLYPLTATTELRLGARLFDDRAATIERYENSFADMEGGNCRLTVRRVSSGTPAPYLVGGINVTSGLRSESMVATTPGVYEATGTPVPGLLAAGTQITFDLVDSGAPTSLDALSFTLDAISNLTVYSPSPVAAVDLSTSFSVSWALLATPGPEIVIEVHDAPREVILQCRTADDGLFVPPSDAIAAFKARSPVAPFALEVRAERQGTAEATIGGQGPIPIHFRAGRGSTYEAL